jgi:hypothetical protein
LFVQVFGEGFGEAIGERLHDDGGIVVALVDELLRLLQFAMTGGDGEAADIVGRLCEAM